MVRSAHAIPGMILLRRWIFHKIALGAIFERASPHFCPKSQSHRDRSEGVEGIPVPVHTVQPQGASGCWLHILSEDLMFRATTLVLAFLLISNPSCVSSAALDLPKAKIMSLNAVVTGANRGIGLEICKQLCADERYKKIFAICRSTSVGLTALAENDKKLSIFDGINVMDENVGTVLQSRLGINTPVNLLVNNAGAYGPPEPDLPADQLYQSQTLENISHERMLFALQLNTLAPLFVTKALLPNLKLPLLSRDEDDSDDISKTAGRHIVGNNKVIIIGSLMGSISDNGSGSHYAYRAAKAAVNQVGRCLAADLRGDSIAVGIVHPGFVFTGFGGEGRSRQDGQRNVGESVKGILDAIEQVTMENTGCFLHGNYGEGVKPINW